MRDEPVKATFQTQLCLNSVILKDFQRHPFMKSEALSKKKGREKKKRFEIWGEVAEQIVMSPLGSCNKVIFLLHFA